MFTPEVVEAARQLGLTRDKGNKVCIYCKTSNIVPGMILCATLAGPDWRPENAGHIGAYACTPCYYKRRNAGSMVVGNHLEVEDGRLIRGGGHCQSELRTEG